MGPHPWVFWGVFEPWEGPPLAKLPLYLNKPS